MFRIIPIIKGRQQQQLQQQLFRRITFSSPPPFHVLKLNAELQSPSSASSRHADVQIIENSHYLQFLSPKFKCSANIKVTTNHLTNSWTIGFIQASEAIDLDFYYKNVGHSKWEFHPLKSGRYSILCDNNNENPPFVSSSAICKLPAGEVSLKQKEIYINAMDQLISLTPWNIDFYNKKGQINQIERKQQFIIWLVAMEHCEEENVDRLFILKTILWNFNVSFYVNCQREIGKRVELVNKLVNTLLMLPSTAQYPFQKELFYQSTCCNDIQSLIFYPLDENLQCILLMPPNSIIVDWSTWLREMTPRSARSISTRWLFDSRWKKPTVVTNDIHKTPRQLEIVHV